MNKKSVLSFFLPYIVLCFLVVYLSNWCPVADVAPGQVNTPEPTPTPHPGEVYLTVSRLDLSVIGECEDIYWGTVPVELVNWTCDDESVITVDNGVVTAVGVGSTTVSCEYNGKRAECTVSCLAEDRKALMKLGEDVVRSPKRIPPIVSDDPITWYNDSAIVGDSISYIMWQWETKYNYLGDVNFFVRGGCSLNGFNLGVMNIYYRGKETPLEDIIYRSEVDKVFLMMGQNDLRYCSIEKTMDNWNALIEKIHDKSPHVEIYIQSLIPEWAKTHSGNANNIKIEEYNVQLEQFCAERGFHFVDVAPYAVDHTGRMPNDYALDRTIHMNEEGCYQWMCLLKSYAYLQELKGES